MKKFKIRFLDSSGKLKEETNDFESAEQIAVYASENQLYIQNIIDLSASISINEKEFVTASQKNLLMFTWQLSVMLNSGALLLESLKLLAKQFSDKTFKSIIQDTILKIENGFLFSAALAEYPQVFTKTYIAAVKSGEATGNIGQVLSSISEFIERREALKTRLKTILTYPLILLTIASGGICFLLIFVLPKFVRIFQSLGVESKTITFLMFFSDILKNYALPALILLFLGSICLYLFSRLMKKNEYFDILIINIPFIGILVSKVNQAMFANTLQILLESGSPIVQAVQISSDTMPNTYISKKVGATVKYIENGEPLHKALQQSEIFSDISLHLISVGEKSGTLSEMLRKVNNYYTKEVEYTLSETLVIIEPAILLILGVIVCLIAVSIFLPINDFIKALHR